MRRALCVLALACLVLLPAADTGAFTIETGFTRGCHEQLATEAFLRRLDTLPIFPDEATPGARWEGVASAYLEGAEGLTRGQRFFLFSLVMGARAPDTEGHSITNAQTLRAAQADPGAQYVHCLREASDDYDAGNATALAGCRNEIVERLASAVRDVRASGGRRADEVERIQVTLDVYGLFETEVWGPAFQLGRALHALQDSFAHTLRTEDMRQVVHVMNFEAPLRGRHDEARDGMAHSQATDRCSSTGEGPNQDRYFAAVDASADLLGVFASHLSAPVAGPEAARDELNAVLSTWLLLADPSTLGDYTACTLENDYCDSPWLELARRSPTTPALACAAAPPAAGSESTPRLPLLLAGLALMGLARARRRRRCRGGGPRARSRARFAAWLALALLAPSALPGIAHADEGEAPASDDRLPARPTPRGTWLGVDLHASLFGDLLDRSTVLPRFGYGLRAGHRFGRYGVFGLVERDHWIVSELDLRYDTGVLNVALGFELSYARGRVVASLALGASVLLQDQVLDQRGSTGLYLALRPAGLRYPVRRRATVQVDLLSFVVEAPVLRHPVLVEAQYRFSVTFEYGL